MIATAPFNGAATLGLRKAAHSPLLRPPSPTFNGAATLGLRKARRQATSARAADSLQWSRNFRAAESGIEPEQNPQSASFNGAATLGLRKAPPAG